MNTNTSPIPSGSLASAEARLLKRQQTFALLRSTHAHVLWLPRYTDVCINGFGGAANIEDIISDPRFYRECEAANQQFGYPGVIWTRSIAETSLTDPACPLLHMFLYRQSGKVQKSLRIREHHRDVVLDVARTEFFRLIGEYQVGEITPSGTCRSWGFEAFLLARLPGRSCAKVLKRLRETTNCEDQLSRIPAQIDSEDDERRDIGIAAVLKSTLRSVLSDDWRRNVFREMIYRSADGKTAAMKTGRPAADIHRKITGPIVRDMQRALGVSGPHCFYFGTKMRTALAAVLPEPEFLELFAGELMT